MERAKLSSKFGSLFMRLFLLVSWCLLILTFLYASLLTIYPNFNVNQGAKGFGVWEDYASNEISIYGYILIGLAGFSILLFLLIKLIVKKIKFTIGKYNKVFSYFYYILFPLLIFALFAFIGTINFKNLHLPGYSDTDSIIFLNLDKLSDSKKFPFGNDTGTWVWLIFVIFFVISVLSIAISTLRFLIRVVFSRTYDKC